MLYVMQIKQVGTATYSNVEDLLDAVRVHFDSYEDAISISTREDDSNKTYPLLELCT